MTLFPANRNESKNSKPNPQWLGLLTARRIKSKMEMEISQDLERASLEGELQR